jgi:centromere-localized protein 2
MPPAPPTETQILHSYLLHPSPLSTILPYKTFFALLPKSSGATQEEQVSQLKRLYHDLEFQRDVVVDDVRRRIDAECARSSEMTARLSRQILREEGERSKSKKRKRSEKEEDDAGHDEDSSTDDEAREIGFDTAMHNNVPLGNTLPVKTMKNNHTTISLLSAMARAKEDLESEIEDLEAELDKVREECDSTVGALSDLRYGRFGGAKGSGNIATEGNRGIENEIITLLGDLRKELEGG